MAAETILGGFAFGAGVAAASRPAAPERSTAAATSATVAGRRACDDAPG